MHSNVVVPCWLPARLLARLALLAKQRGLLEASQRPAASRLLRTWLEQCAGPVSEWPATADEAVSILRELGYSTAQFSTKRFLRGLAADERLATPSEADRNEGTSGAKITPLVPPPPRAPSRREELLGRMLAGEELSESEQRELET